jgi:nitroimidazol reductase NimA-like FMN-containing flavoprotein (pyridoxamine 5'-phosphate oxidase superfamily)
MRLKKAIARLIAWHRVCRVATVGRAGVPHVVAVCHVLVDGRICFGSDRDAKKVQNLRANPHATVVVDLYSDDWSNLKGVMIQGTARLLERGSRFRKVRGLLYRKYPQYPDGSALEEGEAVIVEVTPRHAFSWGFD